VRRFSSGAGTQRGCPFAGSRGDSSAPNGIWSRNSAGRPRGKKAATGVAPPARAVIGAHGDKLRAGSPLTADADKTAHNRGSAEGAMPAYTTP
jgi:hypothetical protein